MPLTAIAFVVQQRFTPLIALDERVIAAATDVTRERPWLRTALVAWQEATVPRFVYAAGTVACLVAWRRHRLGTRAAWAFATMMAAWALQFGLKEVVQRARPTVADPISSAPGFSFPSGHVANVAAASTVLVLLFWPRLSPVGRRVAMAAVVVFTGITGADRMLLGVHYPSDVAAGVIFGVGLAGASYVGYLGWNPVGRDAPPPPEGRTGPEAAEGNS